MDVGAFVQENKRWLVGCAIGGLTWLIASSVVSSLFHSSVVVSTKKLGALSSAYDSSALSMAQDENEHLQVERDRLKRELSFAVSDRYAKWSGPADQHLFLSGRKLRQTIVESASDRDVVADSGSVTWEVPNGIDQIRRVLFGLDMIDEIQLRLFAAHDQVKQDDENATGLVAIESVKLEPTRARRVRRGRNRGGVQLQDLLQQQRVTLQFQSDAATLAGFLEACRQQNRTLIVDRWQVQSPSRPGEACTVKATLAGISFLDS